MTAAETPSDGPSPEDMFADMAAKHDRCFWLDGGGAREWSGRRSLLGWLDEDDVSFTANADGFVRRHGGGDRGGANSRQPESPGEIVGDDIFTVLAEAIAEDPEPDIHWVGYLGYASRTDLPATVETDLVPTAVWMGSRHVTVIEHPEPDDPHHLEDISLPRPGGSSPRHGRLEVPDDYATAFTAVQEALHAGDSYETNLTYRLDIDSDLDPVAAYLRLRTLNPAPYAGFLRHRDAYLLSSSPERFASINRDRVVETKPIKGTTPRSADPAEDARLRAKLMTAPKFRAENLMIVDLLRNDVAMVSVPGSVEVPTLMEVESYESVHQLVSAIRGHLRPDIGTVEVIRALFPAGSMTGAPKSRTMEIIDRVESTPRGAYAGAFGWISGDGRADLGVIIRSLVTDGSGRWRLGTGGGITVASEINEEYAETRWKAERLLRVFD